MRTNFWRQVTFQQLTVIQWEQRTNYDVCFSLWQNQHLHCCVMIPKIAISHVEQPAKVKLQILNRQLVNRTRGFRTIRHRHPQEARRCAPAAPSPGIWKKCRHNYAANETPKIFRSRLSALAVYSVKVGRNIEKNATIFICTIGALKNGRFFGVCCWTDLLLFQ